MDRLFLSGLVREIAPTIRGGRVRSAVVDESGRRLTLTLSLPRPAELVLHIGPGTPGLFLRDVSLRTGRSSPRTAKLSKWLSSAVVFELAISELDRVVTLTLEQTRLSGKKKRIALVFELLAMRTNLFVVDLGSGHIVDCLGVGGLRFSTGDRLLPLEPPRHAARPAVDADELERRLSDGASRQDGDETSPNELLCATGWTPRLVEEMRYWMDEGQSVREAFEIVQEHLARGAPFLYASDEPERRHRVSLSPIELASERALSARPMPSFNEAMIEAVRITVDAVRATSIEKRLESAIRRRLKRLLGLRAKLSRQEETLPAPESLRRRGETLLAGLAQAKTIREGLVRVPDPFDAEGREIEIPIDPRMGLAANAERMFRRSRKAERTRVELERRTTQLDQEIAYAEELQTSLVDASTPAELAALEREAEERGLVESKRLHGRAAPADRKLPPRRFESSQGNVILVGRSARSNEEVTFRSSKPDDLWFHALGMPGSHAVLRLAPGVEAEPNEILQAASLAAHFSKGRDAAHVEVMVTERRNVSKIKGAPPGLVKVQSYRTVRVRPSGGDVR